MSTDTTHVFFWYATQLNYISQLLFRLEWKNKSLSLRIRSYEIFEEFNSTNNSIGQYKVMYLPCIDGLRRTTGPVICRAKSLDCLDSRSPTNTLTPYTSAYHVTVAQHWQASLGWFAPLLARYRAHCRKVSTFQSCWCCCNHRIGCIPQVLQFSQHNQGKLRVKNRNWRKEWELEEHQKCSEGEWKWSDFEGTDFYYPF